MFKNIKEHNVTQIHRYVEQYERCWFHGDANMYDTKEESDKHKKYAHPSLRDAEYRCEFNSGNLPKDIEDLKKKLINSKSQEDGKEMEGGEMQQKRTFSSKPDTKVKDKEDAEFEAMKQEAVDLGIYTAVPNNIKKETLAKKIEDFKNEK